MNTWLYPTPLEPPSSPVVLDPRVVVFNGMPFQARSDCKYRYNYCALFDLIERCKKMTPSEQKARPMENELNILRNLFQTDLWAFVYFVMKNPLANHPFIVDACREVQNDQFDTLHVWARDHLKTSIISVARVCQKVLNDQEKRIAIFSATRPLASKILRVIRSLFETDILKSCFPDILYQDPYREAERWTLEPDGGLFVKRKGFYKEATVSAFGLVEGMPTGDHYTDLVFDDIVTIDTLSDDIMQKVCDTFEMADNVGTRDCQRTVVGTYYRHDDPLVYIGNKVDPETGEKLFKVCKKPATVDGSFAGASAFLPERVLAKKRAGKLYFFFCQQLLNPTPRGMEKLNRDHLISVRKRDLPINLYKFMVIDAAGDLGRRQDRRADAWAMAVVGVEPYRDDMGMSRLYVLDLKIREMDLVQAQGEAVAMYCRNGRILRLGIEKVGMSTTEMHICAALRAKNKFVSVASGNLQILKPGGRSKDFRIESALALPLKHGKIHVLDTVEREDFERLCGEMEKFPAGGDDGLDCLSYAYDIIKDYRFGEKPDAEKVESAYDRAFRRSKERNNTSGWITV